MTTMNTDERDERLKRIRERWPKGTKDDIDFLLSLIDSQAASDTQSLLRRLKDFLFDNCNHNDRDRNYDWCPSCVMAFMEVVSKPSDSDTATRMREACVAELNSLLLEYELEQQERTEDEGHTHRIVRAATLAMQRAIARVESLTLKAAANSVKNDEEEGNMITIKTGLKPFTVPNFVWATQAARPRQEGFVEAPKYALSELSAETLADLCDKFRADVFAKAGKPDPAVKGKE